MKHILRIRLIRLPRLCSSPCFRHRQILREQPVLAVHKPAHRTRTQLLHEPLIRRTLIRLQRGIQPCQTAIMFNRAVQTQFLEIKSARPVTPVKKARGIPRHEEAETRGEVCGILHGFFQHGEGDVAPVAREDVVVREGMEDGARAAAVA